MKNRNKNRFDRVIGGRRLFSEFGCMKGTIRFVGDIISPAYDGPWDAELGIAYQGVHGPVYYTGIGFETTEDVPRV